MIVAQNRSTIPDIVKTCWIEDLLLNEGLVRLGKLTKEQQFERTHTMLVIYEQDDICTTYVLSIIGYVQDNFKSLFEENKDYFQDTDNIEIVQSNFN